MGKAPRDLSQCVIGCLSCDVIALFKFKVTFRFSRSTQILGKFPVSMNGFYPLRSTSNFASFPSFLTASYSCVILPFFLCSNQLFFHSRYSQAITSTCGRWCVTTNLNCSNSYTNLFGLTTSPCEIQSLIAPLSCQRDLLVCFVFTWFVGGNSAKKNSAKKNSAKKSRKETWEMKCTCTSWNGLWPTRLLKLNLKINHY